MNVALKTDFRHDLLEDHAADSVTLGGCWFSCYFAAPGAQNQSFAKKEWSRVGIFISEKLLQSKQ
jgi:hypothetical protein